MGNTLEDWNQVSEPSEALQEWYQRQSQHIEEALEHAQNSQITYPLTAGQYELWVSSFSAGGAGLLAGIAYAVAGLPVPALLGAATALLALIPFGAPVVWVPAGLAPLFQGNWLAGGGILLWGMLVVSWVDNLIRPMVISASTRVPFLLVFFGVVGGAMAFGLIGLFIGPVVLSVLLTLWKEWAAPAEVDFQGGPGAEGGDAP